VRRLGVWTFERDGKVRHSLYVFYPSAFQTYDWQGIRYNVLTRSLPMPQMLPALLIIGFSFPGNLWSSWKSLETSSHVFSFMWALCQYTPSEVLTYVLYSYTKPDLNTVFCEILWCTLVRTYINRSQLDNCTKYCPRAPWRWSKKWTETCSGKF
jgi:hypothetical protein